MFIGHFGLAFGAKIAAPSVSLGALFAACQFADLLWPTLLLAGLEHVEIQPGNTPMTPLDFVSYPYSHSLVMLCLWGAAFGARLRGRAARAARADVTIALLVVSHWLLDYVTHRPDMPLTPGAARFGLGLWNSFAGTLVVEVAIFAVGLAAIPSVDTARARASGSIGLWALVGFLLVVYLGERVRPAAADARAVAWTAQSMWLLVLGLLDQTIGGGHMGKGSAGRRLHQEVRAVRAADSQRDSRHGARRLPRRRGRR